MSASPYQQLVAAPLPRPKPLVTDYVQRVAAGHVKIVWIFVGVFVVLWLVAGTADASGGHSGSVLASFAKSFVFIAPMSMLLIGPVLLYGAVNKSGLMKHVMYGHAALARMRSRDEFHVRGSHLVRVVVEFHDGAGRIAAARFELPHAEAPASGAELRVLHAAGTTAAVVWPGQGVVLARLV